MVMRMMTVKTKMVVLLGIMYDDDDDDDDDEDYADNKLMNNYLNASLVHAMENTFNR